MRILRLPKFYKDAPKIDTRPQLERWGFKIVKEERDAYKCEIPPRWRVTRSLFSLNATIYCEKNKVATFENPQSGLYVV